MSVSTTTARSASDSTARLSVTPSTVGIDQPRPSCQPITPTHSHSLHTAPPDRTHLQVDEFLESRAQDAAEKGEGSRRDASDRGLSDVQAEARYRHVPRHFPALHPWHQVRPETQGPPFGVWLWELLIDQGVRCP